MTRSIPIRRLRDQRVAPGGFSLVEVVLAIGIVSFCLIAVLGLLPTGLKAVKNSNEQAGAAALISAIATSVRGASTTDGISYTTAFGGKTIAFQSYGGAEILTRWTNLTLEGATNSTWPRLSAVLVITPPSTAPAPVRAFISVAWPASATWNPRNFNWTRSEGSLSQSFQFLPR